MFICLFAGNKELNSRSNFIQEGGYDNIMDLTFLRITE